MPYMDPMGICVDYDTYANINKYVKTCKKYTCVDWDRHAFRVGKYQFCTCLCKYIESSILLLQVLVYFAPLRNLRRLFSGSLGRVLPDGTCQSPTSWKQQP